MLDTIWAISGVVGVVHAHFKVSARPLQKKSKLHKLLFITRTYRRAFRHHEAALSTAPSSQHQPEPPLPSLLIPTPTGLLYRTFSNVYGIYPQLHPKCPSLASFGQQHYCLLSVSVCGQRSNPLPTGPVLRAPSPMDSGGSLPCMPRQWPQQLGTSLPRHTWSYCGVSCRMEY